MAMPTSCETVHLIIELPDGKQLEHDRVATDDTLWDILRRFESQFNSNLCRRHNNENRFELPQVLYNSLPFAATLQQLLSTRLSDITKHRKNTPSSTPLILKLVFKAQAFNVNEVETRIQKIQVEKDDVELKNNDDGDGDSDGDAAMHAHQNRKQNGLPRDFADDIDAAQAQDTEVVFRRMEVSLYALCKLLRTPAEFVACLKLLRRIVHNLVVHPLPSVSPAASASVEEADVGKYRKLNLQNEKLQKNLFCYAPALQLLQCIGFERTPDQNGLILPSQRENVLIFQALIVKIDNCPPPKEAVPVVSKDVRIYALRDVQAFKVKEAQRIAAHNAHKNATSDAALSAQHRMAMQNAYKRNHPTQLMGKELRDRKYGVKQKEYKCTVIRVEFPSHKVLEAKFHPNAPITELFEFVHSALTDAVKTYAYELVLPPDQVIKRKQENLTFKGVGGMIPACAVRFRFGKKVAPNLSVDESYIRSELIDKHFTTDITSLRSDQLDNAKDDDNAQSSGTPKNESSSEVKSAADKAKDKALIKAQIKARQKAEAAKRKLQKLDQEK